MVSISHTLDVIQKKQMEKLVYLEVGQDFHFQKDKRLGSFGENWNWNLIVIINIQFQI